MVDRLLGVLIAAVVAEPNIISKLHQNEGDGSLSRGKADPYLRVHQQSMV